MNITFRFCISTVPTRNTKLASYAGEAFSLRRADSLTGVSAPGDPSIFPYAIPLNIGYLDKSPRNDQKKDDHARCRMI